MATYLSRTQSSSNQQIFTVSTWVKLGDLANSMYINNIASDANNRIGIFTFGNNMTFYGINSGVDSVYLRSTALYRDPSAWYHVVVSVDTTQATASDRVKMYVNGERITAFDNEVYPTQNLNFPTNSTHYVGCFLSSNQSYNFYGVMSHYHYTDGYAYDATAFGQTDSTSGVWTPKTAPSVTYGTNGFFLKFANSASLGTDSSGNGNNFTVNGSGTQTLDTPSNVYCTLNPLDKAIYGTAPTISNGNLTYTSSGGGVGSNNGVRSTLGASQGKWYWEAKWVQNVTCWGMQDADVGTKWNTNGFWFESTGSFGVSSNGDKSVDGTVTNSIFTALSANDILGFAYDLDNSKFYLSVNGTWVTSGDPTSGATGTGALGNLTSGLTYIPVICNASYSVSSISHLNFGNGYFGTTAISSPNSDGAGEGKFAYTVPTGYYALNTKNLKTYG